MQDALQNLLAAEHEVQLAGQHRDYGGFAGRASVHIQAAINDVRQGIAYRNGGGT